MTVERAFGQLLSGLRRRSMTVMLAVTAGSALATQAVAQDAAQPAFKPGTAAIVSGLSGLLTGTKDTLVADRSSDRLTAIRRELTDRLLSHTDVQTKITLGGLANNGSGPDYTLSSTSILCAARGEHAVVAADAAYLNTVTGSLNRYATPPKIGNIGEAVGLLFQNYSIEIPKGRTKKETVDAVTRRCANDIAIWPSFSYGRTLEKLRPAETSANELGLDDLAGVGSAVGTLYSAIVAIVQPIAVGGAKLIDAQTRANTISKFISGEKINLINAAQNLADKGARFARKKRMEAVGSFAEKMADLRATEIDLSGTDACKSAIQTPIVALPPGAAATPNRTPTDGFVICYAAAWKQIADASEAVANAANQYDAFADASDDQLQLAVQQLKQNINQVDDPAQAKELWDAAVQLIAFGNTVSQALSKDNTEKANKAVSDLMAVFGKK